MRLCARLPRLNGVLRIVLGLQPGRLLAGAVMSQGQVWSIILGGAALSGAVFAMVALFSHFSEPAPADNVSVYETPTPEPPPPLIPYSRTGKVVVLTYEYPPVGLPAGTYRWDRLTFDIPHNAEVSYVGTWFAARRDWVVLATPEGWSLHVDVNTCQVLRKHSRDPTFRTDYLFQMIIESLRLASGSCSG